jgi:hypothetical protein
MCVPGCNACQRCRDVKKKRYEALKASRPPEPSKQPDYRPGAERYHCRGYKHAVHTVPQLWIPEHLCLDCMARKEKDLGLTFVTEMSRAEDEAEELLALSYGAIAARGR